MKQAKEIKKKIKSIGSIQHITRAMKMVASAKLRKAQAKMEAITPYGHKMDALAAELTATITDYQHPYLSDPKENLPTLLIIIASDKGLCGSFNTNLFRFVDKTLEEEFAGKSPLFLTIGKKATDFIHKKGIKPIASFANKNAAPKLVEVEEIISEVLPLFDNKEIGRVQILYTHFLTTVKYINMNFMLLPFGSIDLPEAPLHGTHDFIYDPNIHSIMDYLLPRIVRMKFYSRLMHGITSEHAARMTSMENATDTSSDMLEELTVTLNKARQETITMELLDIVGGAEALNN
jgi:F-type H+-transporting ATPase subunit gamma